MTQLRVSVAMATCEGASFLAEQLDSLAAQTRLPDELVVSDDASADGSVAIARAFAARAPFEVRVEAHESRVGTTANFERALRACTGDLLFLADQDDVWLPQKVERLSGLLERDASLGLVFSDGEVVGPALEALGYRLWDSLWFDARERARVEEGRAVQVFARHVVAAGTTLAVRASHLELALPFPELRSCHDAFTAFVAAAVSRVRAVPEPLIRYRVHGANQIGLRRLGWRDQLAKAREQLDREAFDYAVQFFEAARARLVAADGTPRCSREVLACIDAKIAHSRRRASMPVGRLSRLPAVANEALGGDYWRFAYGWKSLVQDLWLR